MISEPASFAELRRLQVALLETALPVLVGHMSSGDWANSVRLLCEIFYGNKKGLARFLCVEESTVERWCSGRSRPPETMMRFYNESLLLAAKDKIDKVRGKLPCDEAVIAAE